MLLTISNVLGEAHYTVDGTEPTGTSTNIISMFNGVGYYRWNDRSRDLSSFRVKSFNGTNSSATVAGTFAAATTPSFSPNSGFSSAGVRVTVSNAFGDIWYTTDGTEPAIGQGAALSMTNGVNWILWTNLDLDLSFLRVKAFSAVVDNANPATHSATVGGEYYPPTTPLFPPCGLLSVGQGIAISNLVGEVHYTTDGTDPSFNSPYLTPVQTNGAYTVYNLTWTDSNHLNMSWLALRTFLGRSNMTQTARGIAHCAPIAPVISPTCGYYPNGKDIAVYEINDSEIRVFYTIDGSEPTPSSDEVAMSGGVGVIHWTNALHDLSWLSVKAFSGSASSDTVRGQSCEITTPSYGPVCGFYTNCINIWVTNRLGDVHYTVDGTEPSFESPVVPMTNGLGVIRWCDTMRDLSYLRMRAYSGPENYSAVVGGADCSPSTPTFGPSSGYFPDGETIWVTNQIGSVYYTTDGTEPTLNSQMATRLANGIHVIHWNDALHDLSSFRAKAFAGENGGTTVFGQAAATNEIGFVHDYDTGPGSTAVIPLVMNLRPGVTVRTILFSVDVTPLDSNTNLITTEMQGRRPKSTDFFQVLRPASGTSDYQMGIKTTIASNATHLQVTVTSTNMGFTAKDHSVPLMICVPIPVAPTGSAWSLGVSRISATTDGKTAISIGAMSNRTLNVSNISYMVGDVAPSCWYSGRAAFGDSSLTGADINLIYYVSAWEDGVSAVNMPFNDLTNSASPEATRSLCDLLDAMDAFPVKKPDGVVGYLDGEVILNRYFGNDTSAWMRTWGADGKRTTTKVGSVSSLAQSVTATRLAASSEEPTGEGTVWVPQARISSETQEQVQPGQVCSFPVCVDVAQGCQLAGLQIHPIIEAQDGAPEVDGVQYWSKAGAEPLLLANNSNDVIVRYSLALAPSFDPALTGRVYLGDVLFQAPANAQEGQAYTVRFVKSDGAPDLETAYQFESFRATAWISSSALRADSQTPDEWKHSFFGSATNALAADNADPDQDGMSNLQEFLAGTNPTNATSRVQFINPVSDGNGGLALSWLSAPNKYYTVERSDSIPGTNWTTLGSMTGTGSILTYIDSSAGTGMRYYRLRVQTP
jgi:hypothetical protein